MQEKGDHRAQKADHKALVHKGPADKTVGGTHHSHDGDFLSPVKGGELDGIGDDEHRHNEQNRDQRHAYHRGHVPHGDKASGDLLKGVDLCNALYFLHLFHCLALQLQIHHPDGKAVPEDGRVQILKHLFVGILGLEVLHGLLLGDVCSGCHIGYFLQLTLQRLGLLLGVGVIYIGQNLIFLLQIRKQGVGVDRHQCKRPHDQKTRHGDADGCEGHEAMAEHIAQAFMKKIPEIMPFSHGYALPHSRLRCR